MQASEKRAQEPTFPQPVATMMFQEVASSDRSMRMASKPTFRSNADIGPYLVNIVHGNPRTHPFIATMM